MSYDACPVCCHGVWLVLCDKLCLGWHLSSHGCHGDCSRAEALDKKTLWDKTPWINSRVIDALNLGIINSKHKSELHCFIVYIHLNQHPRPFSVGFMNLEAPWIPLQRLHKDDSAEWACQCCCCLAVVHGIPLILRRFRLECPTRDQKPVFQGSQILPVLDPPCAFAHMNTPIFRIKLIWP